MRCRSESHRQGGASTLLKPEIGLHVLELPHGDGRSFDRATVLVDVEPVGAETNGSQSERPEPAIVRRYRHEPSPLVATRPGRAPAGST